MSARLTPDRQAIEDLRAIADLMEALAVANHARQFRIRRRTLHLLRRMQLAAIGQLTAARSHNENVYTSQHNEPLPNQDRSVNNVSE